MKSEKYKVIGVMSGTSLDGIDIAEIAFTVKNDTWKFSLLNVETIPYSDAWFNELKLAAFKTEQEIQELNQSYTKLLGTIILNFIHKNKCQPDLVASHGHTILHQPERGLTLQIGNLPLLKEIIGLPVVCDFRVQDVAMGGQGAPLVPVGDKILFSMYDYCINLGGFSNISFDLNNRRLAYDICPVNTVLNFYANKAGAEYDDKGNWARNGKINATLLQKLNANVFFEKEAPKSLGIEFVFKEVIPLIDASDCTIADILATYVEHIAFQISENITRRESTILLTGGGAFNDFLIERLRHYLPRHKLVIPEPKTINFKEALIFGLLGVLRYENQINVLSSVTGASQDHSSGVVL